MKFFILSLTLLSALPVFGQTFINPVAPDKVTDLVNWGNTKCERMIIVYPDIDQIKLKDNLLSFRLSLENVKGSGSDQPFNPQILIQIADDGPIITFLKLPVQTKGLITQVETTLTDQAAETLRNTDIGLLITTNASQCGADNKRLKYIPDEQFER